MSYNVEGSQCQYCHAKLFKDDDVVVCPECGAPHHRECYKSLGHCALEEYHGTENCYVPPVQTAKEQENDKTSHSEQPGVSAQIRVKCQMCGEEYSPDASACPKCKAPNIQKIGGNAVFFDFLGGVAPDYDLGEGVIADEAKRFVMANTNKYIPKFVKIRSGKKVFFNILAFLFPCQWLLSRKMYKLGALITAVQVALSTLLLPYYLKIQNILPQTVTVANANKYMDELMKVMSKGNMLIYFAIIFAIFLLHLLFGMFGDLIYRNHVISTVKNIKTNETDFEEAMHKKGGVSLLMLIFGFLITTYLPEIIAILAGV